MPPQATQKQRSGRAWAFRIVALFVIIGGLGFGWNYAWHRAAEIVDTETTRLIEQSNDAGREIECAGRRVEGFPFRVGIFCDSLSLYAERNAMSVKSGALRSAAQFYKPGLVVAELDGPLTADLPGAGNYLARWDSLRASVNVSLSGLRRVSVVANKLNLAESDAAISPLSANAESIELHLRPAKEAGHEGAVDLALLADNLTVSGAGLTPLPAIALGADLRLDGMKSQLQPGFDLMRHLRANGVSGQIRRAQLLPIKGGGITVTGPFDIGRDGILSAKLDVTVNDTGAIAAFLGKMFPDQEELWTRLRQAVTLLAAADSTGSNGRSFSLSIDHGAVAIGFIPLGEIKPLF